MVDDVQIHDLARRIVDGTLTLRNLPNNLTPDEKARVRLLAAHLLVGAREESLSNDEVLQTAEGRNCENMAGVITVPFGLVGPVAFPNEVPHFLPLATTEGALIASVQRGLKALKTSGKTGFLIEDFGMTRAPVFRVSSIDMAEKVRHYLQSPDSQALLTPFFQATSKHLSLTKISTRLVGRNLFIKFFFDTQAAMGMNMVTIATQKIVEHLENKFGIECLSLSGNGCVDKKPAWGNVLEGRGIRVQAEATILRSAIDDILKTSPEKIVDVSIAKNYVGSAAFGSMGFNGHFANIVAAFYLATGQDMAHVVEGSVGMTTAEVVDEGLYISVTLPNVLLGVVGGGTVLPAQQRSLRLMGLADKTYESKKKFARNLAYLVMAGELSLLAALAEKQLACAHQALGRRKHD